MVFAAGGVRGGGEGVRMGSRRELRAKAHDLRSL